MDVGMRKALLVVSYIPPNPWRSRAVWSISEGAGTMAASPKATNVAAPVPMRMKAGTAGEGRFDDVRVH
jgi:hypothetical protein